MRISSFNVNKFCGLDTFNGWYSNPKKIDYINPIKE